MPLSPYPPTDEQQKILDAYGLGKDLVIEAGAGAGKTSTLRFIGEYDLSRDGVAISYNKAIAVDMAKVFPKNVKCSTSHSLAYSVWGRKYAHRLNGERLPSKEVAQRLGLSSMFLNGKEMPAPQLARIVLETVMKFSYSAESKPQRWMVPEVPGVEGGAIDQLQKAAIAGAIRAWDDITNVDGKLKFEHDYYLKMWALHNPRIEADVILLDEGQDTNPVLAKVFESQKHAQRILVGDENQAIYAWRGAVNAMRDFKGTRLQLTQSFRFGQAIAEEANKWLTALDSNLKMRGNEKRNSSLGALVDAAAILNRTNGGAMASVIQQQARGKRVAIVGGANAIRALAFAAIDLRAGRRTDHPELFMFETWDEVREYVEEDPSGADLKTFVKMVDSFGTQALIDAAKACVDEDYADVVVSTAHRSKGREWETVRIGDDFAEEPDPETGLYLPSPATMMLAYVAVTRAKSILDRGGLAWVDVMLNQKLGTPIPIDPNLPAIPTGKLPNVVVGEAKRRPYVLRGRDA